MIVNAETAGVRVRWRAAVGRIIEVLGRPDDFGIDVEITDPQSTTCRTSFPPAVDGAGADVPLTIGERGTQGRRDFRDLPIRDDRRRDRARLRRCRVRRASAERQLHSAGPYCRREPLRAAGHRRSIARRGCAAPASTFPDRAVPMLPFELSTDICSLKPQVDRLVLSALLELDHHGDSSGRNSMRGVIRSAERMTYTSVHCCWKATPRCANAIAAGGRGSS